MGSYVARRVGGEIRSPVGRVVVLNEGANGVLVVRVPRCKHWKDGEPDLPVRYQLARLHTGPGALLQRGRTACNSAHYEEYPDVIEFLDTEVVAGKRWRAALKEAVEKAEAFD